MNLLSWILFGAIVGAASTFFDSHLSGASFIKVVILGIFGAVSGGLIGNMLFQVDTSQFSLDSFLAATSGSLLLLFLGRSVVRSRRMNV